MNGKTGKAREIAGSAQRRAALVMVSALALSALFACGGGAEKEDWIDASYGEAEEAASGGEVNFYMWGGDERINSWIDDFVGTRLEEEYGISINRVPMDASVFINKLLAEKEAGKRTGVIDLVWINGENFKRAKENGLLYGAVAGKLPNIDYVPPEEIEYDFGYPVEGYEVPYGKAQFVFEYDSAEYDAPPQSFAELPRWVEDHPGEFTYPQPPDFTGSAFVRQALYAVTGGHEQYLGEYDEELIQENEDALWDYLKELEPHLWQSGRDYPQDKARLDLLFERGEVGINMDYNPLAASGKVLDGRYPETVRTFVMEEGAISNIHYVAIPFNAPNVPEAMVTADFLLSPEAQLSKNRPENWGDLTVLDPQKLPEKWQESFEELDLGPAALPVEELSEAAVPEISAGYVEYLEKRWEEEMLQ
mgnify:CR=1 FL=1